MSTVVRTCRVEDTPGPFRDLAWQVFFASRGRGVSLDAHFPWIGGGGRDDRSWLMEVDGRPAAMLCVRRGIVADVHFSAIGLVCTAPDFERRGFATRLLKTALDAIGEDAPVLLWTSQHAFYARLGFELIDPTLVAACVFPPEIAVDRHGTCWQRYDWTARDRVSPCFGGQRGVPTFVTSVERWSLIDDPAEFLVLSPGDKAPIVLEMGLCGEAVARELAALKVARAVLNLPRHVPAIDQLQAAGVGVAMRETAIAMWRPGRFDREEIMQWDIPLLDRF
ncbi:GNAT family N-acetyltransferase [Sphingomonas dokdonensis]|uniref:N-acetyltransferase domain-containing protein n=1 Tax=Sphingomonas dokdonensis TaxID=344880 RepID=A0A2D0A4M2_9SPHN|nr:GNAT family N-acetyltransferase [Sphingomonas dokdonensis]OWK27839.1 hypothetical protein SPDO_30790 [Sphingomonas dokdonensis]